MKSLSNAGQMFVGVAISIAFALATWAFIPFFETRVLSVFGRTLLGLFVFLFPFFLPEIILGIVFVWEGSKVLGISLLVMGLVISSYVGLVSLGLAPVP